MTRDELVRAADAVTCSVDGWSGLRRSDFDASLVAQAVSAHEHAPKATLKDDARSRVTVVEALESTVVVKEVRKAGWRRRLADSLRGAPAARAFTAGYALRSAGIGAALPLAFVATTRAGVPMRSLLLSRDLRPFPTAADHAARDPAAAIDLLCDLALRLHRERFVHGDLRAQHVHLCGADRSPSLIDLESVRQVAKLSDEHRMAALAQLNASLPDDVVPAALRERALERYANALPFAADYREVRDRIVAMSRARGHLWRGDRCTGG